MAMPEAAVNKDCLLPPNECDVGLSGQVTPVQAIAGEARLAKRSAHGELRLRVLGTDSAHIGAAPLWIQLVHINRSEVGFAPSLARQRAEPPLQADQAAAIDVLDHPSARIPRARACLRQLSVSCPDPVSVDVDHVIEHEVVAKQSFASPHQAGGIKFIRHEHILELFGLPTQRCNIPRIPSGILSPGRRARSISPGRTIATSTLFSFPPALALLNPGIS